MKYTDLKSKSKITAATMKAFVNKAQALFLQKESQFDGMTDCVEMCEDRKQLKPIAKENALKVHGAWIVQGGRNWFKFRETETHFGIEVHNSCNTATLWTNK